MRGITLYLDEALEERERERRRKARKAYAYALAIALAGVVLALRPRAPAVVAASVPVIDIRERFGPPAPGPAVPDERSGKDSIPSEEDTRDPRPDSHGTLTTTSTGSITTSNTTTLNTTTSNTTTAGTTEEDVAAISFGSTYGNLNGAGVRETSRHLCVSPKWIRRRQHSKTPERVTISNPGDEAVKITRIATATNRGRSGFSVDALGCRGRTLQPGEHCTIVVTQEEQAAESMEVLVFTEAGSHLLTIAATAPQQPAGRGRTATRMSWWRRR